VAQFGDVGGYRVAPGRTWRDHRGRPAPESVYAVPPDPSIGEVRTAWSNQTRNGYRQPSRAAVRRVLGAIVRGTPLAFVGGVATAYALDLIDAYRWLGVGWLPIVVAWAPWITIGLAIGDWMQRPRPVSSYVGELGLHEHAQGIFRGRDAILLFEDAATMTHEETAEHVDGSYRGTRFSLVWRNLRGDVVYTIGGVRFDHGIWADAHEAPGWAFACAAEARWNEVLAARASKRP
jgi:hypothetical protein